jgi:saccharopine dehydrogenase-like NADP-dependent oxidoreductase
MKTIKILGCGRIGAAIVKDLLQDEDLLVKVYERDATRLDSLASHPRLECFQADATDEVVLQKTLDGQGILINALPGSLGFGLLKSGIEAGHTMVDISFAPEDPLVLNELARGKGVTAIVDMGVAPGMSHLLAGWAASEMDHITELEIMVGGLPRERKLPFEYKAGFSPADVIEEYTRPVYLIEGGKKVKREALSGLETIDFPGIGTLEAFLSDGLRTLTHSIQAEEMREKTLRYPGHAALMKLFRDTGLFGREAVWVGNQEIIPLELTSALLFRHWELRPGEEDFTVMRVMARGLREHQRVIFAAALYDAYDRESGIHSMARTTGYAATAALRLLLSGQLKESGIIVPEKLGMRQEWRHFMLEDQRKRGIDYRISVEKEEDWSTGECGS